MEHKRKVVELECFLIVITVAEIIHIVSELGKENKIVGNKSEEDLAAVLADTLCFADTFLFVHIIFQMIKRAEQKDNIKRLICISREVKGIALNKIDFIFGCQFLFECVVLCQDLVQVKMSFSHSNLPAIPKLPVDTILQNHRVTYNRNDYEFVWYYKTFPSIQIPGGMHVCNC